MGNQLIKEPPSSELPRDRKSRGFLAVFGMFAFQAECGKFGPWLLAANSDLVPHQVKGRTSSTLIELPSQAIKSTYVVVVGKGLFVRITEGTRYEIKSFFRSLSEPENKFRADCLSQTNVSRQG